MEPATTRNPLFRPGGKPAVIVDAADYVVWRNALGTHLPLANETASPGNVDLEDYLV
jgi:hypothetical protein